MLNSQAMGDRDATTAGPVVLCCANADADTIRPVVDDLEGQGHLVILLDDVQQSPESLVPTVERLHGEGLYVLCRSKALGRNAVDELRDILLAHHVPFGRTLTVASTRPRELRERIGASLRRLATSNARRMSTVSPDEPKRRGSTRLGLPTPPRPKPAPTNDFEFEAATDVRPGATKTQVGLPAPDAAILPPPPPPQSKTATIVETAPGATDGTEQDDEAPTESLEVDPSLSGESAPSLTRLEGPDALDDLHGVEGLDGAEGLDAADLEVDLDEEPPARLTPAVEPERGPAPDVQAAPEPVSPPAPSSRVLIRPDELADLDEPPVQRELPQPPVRTGNTKVSAVLQSQLTAIRTGDTAIVSREALLAAGLENLGPPPPSPPPPSSPATVRVPAVPQTVRAPAIAAATSEPSSGPPWMWIGIGGAALALIIVIAVALSGSDADEERADDDTVAQAETANEPKDDSRDAAESSEDEDEDASKGESPAAGPGPTRIGHALRSREIRSLDVLLVSNTEGPLSWDAAKTHCSGLDLAGLGAWRLPEVGELMSLSTAAMTLPGYYWTGTPADTFGDTPLVWYPRRSKVVTRDSDSLVLCVRGGTTAG